MNKNELIWKNLLVQIKWVDAWIFQSIKDWMMEEWQEAKIVKIKSTNSLAIKFAPKSLNKLIIAMNVIYDFWFEQSDLIMSTAKA